MARSREIVHKCSRCGETFVGGPQRKFCIGCQSPNKNSTPEQKAQNMEAKNAARRKKNANSPDELLEMASELSLSLPDEDASNKSVFASKLIREMHECLALFHVAKQLLNPRDFPSAIMQLSKVYEVVTGGQAPKHNYTTIQIAIVPPIEKRHATTEH